MGMSRSEIEQELKNVLLKIIDAEPEEFKPQAHFFKDLGADSIKAIEITVAIEKHFKIEIKEDDIAGVTTLEKAAEVVHKYLDKKG